MQPSVFYWATQVVLLVRKPPASAGDIDLGLIPGLGRSPGEGNGNPLWYSCWENPMNKGTWQATVYGVAKNRTRLKQISSQAYTFSSQAHQIVFKITDQKWAAWTPGSPGTEGRACLHLQAPPDLPDSASWLLPSAFRSDPGLNRMTILCPQVSPPLPSQ